MTSGSSTVPQSKTEPDDSAAAGVCGPLSPLTLHRNVLVNGTLVLASLCVQHSCHSRQDIATTAALGWLVGLISARYHACSKARQVKTMKHNELVEYSIPYLATSRATHAVQHMWQETYPANETSATLPYPKFYSVPDFMSAPHGCCCRLCYVNFVSPPSCPADYDLQAHQAVFST